MPELSVLDALALGWFLIAWIGYSLLLEKSPLGRLTLSARMNAERGRWMEQLAAREHRIVDTSIMTGLQQGTAFFASTALIAIGGALAMLRAHGEAGMLARALPFATQVTPEMWEVKVLGLVVIFVHAFFKFAWAYRLFNYAAILMGAVPAARDGHPEEALAKARKAGAMQTTAASEFNRGLRAFFFALGYLGWFISPIALMLSTTGVLIVLARRQFSSAALRAVSSGD